MRLGQIVLVLPQDEGVSSNGPLAGLGVGSEGRCLLRGREGSEVRERRASTFFKGVARLI